MGALSRKSGRVPPRADGAQVGKCKTSAMLHGSALLKRTSATLHGNAFFLNHEPSTGPDRTRPPKRQPKATQEDAQDRKRTAPRIDK